MGVQFPRYHCTTVNHVLLTNKDSYTIHISAMDLFIQKQIENRTDEILTPSEILLHKRSLRFAST